MFSFIIEKRLNTILVILFSTLNFIFYILYFLYLVMNFIFEVFLMTSLNTCYAKRILTFDTLYFGAFILDMASFITALRRKRRIS